MTGDLDDLDDIADQSDFRTSKTAPQGRKRGRVSHHRSPLKGTLKTILARAKGRKQKISLPNIDPKRP